MKGIHRALLGALIGAVLTILIHPRTSPSFRSVFMSGSPKGLSSIDRIKSWEGSPQTEADYCYAAEIFSERIRQGKLTAAERTTAGQLFRKASVKFPKNAFWNQMYASYFVRQGDLRAASKEWRQASLKPEWSSGQSALGVERAQRMANQLGFTQSWIWARAFLTRSSAPALEIEHTARALLAQASMREEPGISTRFDTALNGNLMKKRAKLIGEGSIGTELVQLTAYPPNLTDTSRPKQLYLGQDLVADSLRNHRRSADADQLVRVFQDAESWAGLVSRRSVPEQVDRMLLGTLLTSTLGGLAILMLLLGLMILAIQSSLEGYLTRQRRFLPVAILPFAVVMGGGVGYAIDYWVGGIVFTIVILSWLWQPSSIRKVNPDDLGPLFNLTLRFLLLLAISFFFLFVVWNSLPFGAITPLNANPWEGWDAKGWLRVAVLVLSLLFLVVPTWAFAQRLSCPAVARCLLIRTRTTLIWLGIALILVLGPASLVLDRQQQDAWHQMIRNEPFYYLL